MPPLNFRKTTHDFVLKLWHNYTFFGLGFSLIFTQKTKQHRLESGTYPTHGLAICDHKTKKKYYSLLVMILYVVILRYSIRNITGLIDNVNYNIALILTSYHVSSAPLIECYNKIHTYKRMESSLQIFH